ncbi:MAG: PLDc N-terminal domain-containing protein [Candidatus Methanoperedens sp.]|nr:PLDc N-terminal domain-containing protein [Candidatus Methanoperedens sp.]
MIGTNEILSILFVPVFIFVIVFWLWMLIDCLKRPDGKFAVGGQNAKLIWVLIILIMPFIVANIGLLVPDVITHMFRLLFAQVIGALIYYFLVKRKE